jgi:uncharacterized protein (DUF2141 family)
MKKIFFTLILFIFFSTSLYAKETFIKSGNINIVVKNIKSNHGLLRLFLIKIKDKRLKTPGKTLKEETNIIRYNKSIFTLKNIPAGWYAIYIIHDRNENGKLDYMKLSKPREGFGASNNGVSNIGKPIFKRASFLLDKKNLNMVIPLNYY